MKAKEGVKYALLNNNKVVDIFDSTKMSEWNENDLTIIEIPDILENKIDVLKAEYINNTWVINEDYEPLNLDSYSNNLFAVIKDNKVENIISKENYKEDIKYDKERYKYYNIIPIPSDKELEITNGCKYIDNNFIIDIETLKYIYLQYSNECYEKISNKITEGSNISEMLSWSLQESEARAYKESKDINQAFFISQLAKSRNIDIDLLVDKILEKSELYKKGLSNLLGYKQAIDTQIQNATTLEEVRSAKFNIDNFK